MPLLLKGGIMSKNKTTVVPEVPKPELAALEPITKEKCLLDIKELVIQLNIVELEWAKRKSLESEREMLLLAIAERKGVIAYINSGGG